MNFSVTELQLAGDLIYWMLSYLNHAGITDIDPDSVNYSASAFRALEKECLEGPEEEDRSLDGMMKKGARFVTAAIDFDGVPVVAEGDIVCPILVGQIVETKDGE
jgi:hypothetical protein